jgi:tetratricopeptide (TPR) repeat protein
MRRASRLAAVVTVALVLAGTRTGTAQAVLGPAFEHERAGRPAQAAAAYLNVLKADAASVAALLGLERVLPGLGRLSELVPLVARARLAAPDNALIRGVELRMYAALGQIDSVGAAVRRWAAAAPRDETPYREWAIVLQDRGLVDDARRALLQGREALRRPAALAIELAELELRAMHWDASAREWGLAVSATPAQHANAVGQLEGVPDEARPLVLRQLWGPANPGAQRVAAELLLAWGEPLRGWTLLEGTLTPPGAEVPALLRRFADRAAAVGTPAGRRARGLALERYANLVPSPMAVRAWADASRAFLSAGDRDGARRVLERMGADSTTPPEAQVLAQSAFLQALIEEGQLDSATARLETMTPRISSDDRETLRFAIARARLARGELDQAGALLAGDSTVAGLAMQGWVALYRGHLKDATALFRAAGPYALDRRDATERTAMLALLQRITADSSPQLGAGLLRLARADSAGALEALRQAASTLGSGGRPDVLLLAGQVAAGMPLRETEAAELFEEVIRTAGTGAAAPAAELAWAKLLRRQERPQEAVQHLEHLILTYPGSAVVPEARRELERARGTIPRS